MLRFFILLGVYVVLGFGLFAATGLLSGKSPTLVAGVMFAASLWSVSLTTFLEQKGYRRPDPRERVAFGALVGALSVGGFTSALSWLAWGRIDTVLVPIAALLGGAMQAGRAFSIGAFTPANNEGDEEEEVETESTDMDPKQLIASGAVVVDVRRQEEFDAGHLPTAHLVPIDAFEGRVGEVEGWVGGDKTKPVVVYCRSGARSGRAKTILEKHGFTQVVNGGGYGNLK